LTKEALAMTTKFTPWFLLLAVTLLVLAACAAPAEPVADPVVRDEAGETPEVEAPVEVEETPEVEAPVEVEETPEVEAPVEVEETPEVEAPVQTEEPIEFVVAHPGGIGTMDAPKAWDWPTVYLHNQMHDCLIWLRADGTGFDGKLAESWESLDASTWRFHLRPGLTYHNGESLQADAVKWSIDRVRSREDFLVYPQWQFIEDVQVVDDLTLDITTVEPNHAYFLNNMASNGCQILPPEYMEEVGEEGYGENPIGAGPYRLAEFTPGDRYVFEAWDDYWGGRPEVDRVIYQVIPEQSTQIAALLTGQIHLVPSIPLPDIATVEAAEGVEVVRGPANISASLVLRPTNDTGAMQETFNGYEASTTDVRIRRAISHALDRTMLAEVQGSATPVLVRIGRFFPESIADRYVGEEAADAWYDPELARQLIREAGYDPDAGNRPMANIDAPSYIHGNEKEVAEVMATMLEDVGFEVTLNLLDWAALREQIEAPGNNREIYLRFNSGFVGLVPLFYNCEWMENIYRVPDDSCEEWGEIGSAIMSTLDEEERLALWERWQELYVDEVAVYASIYQVDRVYGVNSDFEFTPRADGFLTFRELRLRR
jgi:peptide/nickel transport system substrate-binding protein